MAKKPLYEKDLDKVLAKINKLKPTSAKAERAQTSRVKTYDLTPDPYLVGIAARTAGKVSKKPLTPERIRKGFQAKMAKQRAQVIAHATHASKPIRRDIPDTHTLTALMAPDLPPWKGKPNIVALIYAFRAFQQFSHGFTRRKLGDPASREIYYQERKRIFEQAMRDIGMYDLFDWSDF